MLQQRLALLTTVLFAAASPAFAQPQGFVSHTIPIGAPPAAVAFDDAGQLYVLEAPIYGDTTTKLHVVDAGGSITSTATIAGEDGDFLFIGGMTYDPVSQGVLVTDNAGSGRLYSFDAAGNRQTIATGIANITGVQVRSSGEIFVSTAPFGASGEVLVVDRTTGATTLALGGLSLGAGLDFQADGDLIVQDVAYDAQFNPNGSLRRLPIAESMGSLTFGAPELLLSGAASSYGVVVVGDDEFLTTGSGGLYQVAGSPLAETVFSGSGTSEQFSSAIDFEPGAAPFEPFAGAAGGRVAYVAEASYGLEDDFLTVIAPAEPTDFNSDCLIDGADLAVWSTGFGAASPERFEGDANADGVVNGADFLAWQRSYQIAQQLAPAQFAAHRVPEPSSLLFAVVLSAISLANVRRRVE